MDTVNQIRKLGATFPNQKDREKILANFPNKFELKIITIEVSCDLTTLTIAELISKLQVQEQRVTM